MRARRLEILTLVRTRCYVPGHSARKNARRSARRHDSAWRRDRESRASSDSGARPREKIYLDLRQIVEAVIKNLAKLFQKPRCRNLFGGIAVQIGLVGDLLSAAKLLKGSQ